MANERRCSLKPIFDDRKYLIQPTRGESFSVYYVDELMPRQVLSTYQDQEDGRRSNDPEETATDVDAPTVKILQLSPNCHPRDDETDWKTCKVPAQFSKCEY